MAVGFGYFHIDFEGYLGLVSLEAYRFFEGGGDLKEANQ